MLKFGILVAILLHLMSLMCQMKARFNAIRSGLQLNNVAVVVNLYQPRLCGSVGQCMQGALVGVLSGTNALQPLRETDHVKVA